MARNQTTFEPGHKGKGGRPPGARNTATLEVRELARLLIEDPAYRSNLRRRLIAGKAAQMEALLFKYAYGQPVERYEVSAEVTAASHGPSQPAADGATGAEYSRGVMIGGTFVTPEGAERIRRLMSIIIDNANREGAKAKAAEQSAAEVNAADPSPSDATIPPGSVA